MKTTIKLKNLSQAIIFEHEISGQISDGQWENARPYNHWEWISNVAYDINENNEPSYISCVPHKTYAVFNFIKKYDDDLHNRIYNLGKLGKVLEKLHLEDKFNNSYLGYIIEDLPLIRKYDFREWLKKWVGEYDFRKAYVEKSWITHEIYEEFYKVNYDYKHDFLEDAKILDKALKNFKYI